MFIRAISLLFIIIPHSSLASAATYNITTYFWIGENNGDSNNNTNWFFQSTNAYGIIVNSGYGIPTSNSDIIFNTGNNNCSWNLEGTFGNVYLESGYSGDLSFSNNVTFQSLSVDNGRVIIDNYSITISGFYNQNDAGIIIIQHYFDIGLAIVILSCGFIFVGFILKFFKGNYKGD